MGWWRGDGEVRVRVSEGEGKGGGVRVGQGLIESRSEREG